MDSVNFFKGYDYIRVNNLETQNSHPKRKISQKPLSIALTISAILLFILVIGSTLAGLVLVPIKDSADSPSPSLSFDSIIILCNVTRYRDSCFAALSSLNTSLKPDPRTFLNLSLQVAITHLQSLTLSLKSLNDLNSQTALSDCLSLFDDALSRLNDSVSAMKVGLGKELVLTKEKLSDIQTWISAALSDQDTCNDGLEEMGSTVDDKVKSQFQGCKESISNSLAITANMQTLLQKFGLTMN